MIANIQDDSETFRMTDKKCSGSQKTLRVDWAG